MTRQTTLTTLTRTAIALAAAAAVLTLGALAGPGHDHGEKASKMDALAKTAAPMMPPESSTCLR